jgi:putative endonuclease
MPLNTYWVYIVASVSRTHYIGVTNDLERRLWEHRTGYGSQFAFAHRHHCTDLVFVEPYSDIRDAIAREKQLKGWSRQKKCALIEAANPAWIDLSAEWPDGLVAGP